MNLVQEVSNLLLPLIELNVLHLNGILQVHDSMGPRVHHLSDQLQLSVSMVQPILGLDQAVVQGL
jgi:hypothetical protein